MTQESLLDRKIRLTRKSIDGKWADLSSGKFGTEPEPACVMCWGFECTGCPLYEYLGELCYSPGNAYCEWSRLRTFTNWENCILTNADKPEVVEAAKKVQAELRGTLNMLMTQKDNVNFTTRGVTHLGEALHTLKVVADALGTGETGGDLVAVARAAHEAEQRVPELEEKLRIMQDQHKATARAIFEIFEDSHEAEQREAKHQSVKGDRGQGESSVLKSIDMKRVGLLIGARVEVTLVPHGFEVDVWQDSEEQPGETRVAGYCFDFGGAYKTDLLADRIARFLVDALRKELVWLCSGADKT